MKKEMNRPLYSASERKKYLAPLLGNIAKHYQKNKTAIIGVQGGQGTGKTTLAKFLQEQLRQKGYAVESFSIDDFYTSYAERKRLAQQYPSNPFYQIPRGMPGTHRVSELLLVLQRINAGKPFAIPHFDKSLHHGAGDVDGERKVKVRVDFVLFEGWCVGLPLINKKELEKICQRNKISLPSGYGIVLRFLKSYQPLWEYIHYLVMLKPRRSELHLRWRRQQEQELRQQKGSSMNQKEIGHFVDIYLPLTYVCYEKVNADAVLTIDEKHRFVKLNIPKS